MENFSLLFSLPETLQISIAIIVAKSGASQLRPLIISGKRGMLLAFNNQVLRSALVDYPAIHPNFFNEDSVFRSFMFRCVLSGNPKACYLESLRLAIQYEALEASAQLLRNIVNPDPRMSFAFALILFTSHRYDEAVPAIKKFKEAIGSFDEAVFVSQCVYWDIESIGPLNRVLFITTWQHFMLYPPFRGQNCTLCILDESCASCCYWWRHPIWDPMDTHPPDRAPGCEFALVNSACEQCTKWWSEDGF